MDTKPRSTVAEVALPSEHGGWGLTLEPALLGLLVAPSWAGVCLGIGALIAFLARTPLRVVLVDRFRSRSLARTGLARRVLAIEVAILVALAVLTVTIVDGTSRWWLPLLVALPLLAIELWFDMRSRSRRLIPELAGAVAIASVAATVALAGGEATALSYGLWAILAARGITSIPHVRAMIDKVHHRPVDTGVLAIADVSALTVAAVAIGLDTSLLAGAMAIAVMAIIQRVIDQGPVRPAVVLGAIQTVLGLGVVIATAVGVAVA